MRRQSGGPGISAHARCRAAGGECGHAQVGHFWTGRCAHAQWEAGAGWWQLQHYLPALPAATTPRPREKSGSERLCEAASSSLL